jgi:hypothetical protein
MLSTCNFVPSETAAAWKPPSALSPLYITVKNFDFPLPIAGEGLGVRGHLT